MGLEYPVSRSPGSQTQSQGQTCHRDHQVAIDSSSFPLCPANGSTDSAPRTKTSEAGWARPPLSELSTAESSYSKNMKMEIVADQNFPESSDLHRWSIITQLIGASMARFKQISTCDFRCCNGKLTKHGFYLLKNAVFTGLQVISYSLCFFSGDTAICGAPWPWTEVQVAWCLSTRRACRVAMSGGCWSNPPISEMASWWGGVSKDESSHHQMCQYIGNGRVYQWFQMVRLEFPCCIQFIKLLNSKVHSKKGPQNVKDPNCCLDSIPNHVVTWVCLFLTENVSACFSRNSVLTLWYSYYNG